MEKLQAKVVGKSFRRTAPGGVVSLSRRDARLLEVLGRVEIIHDDNRATYAYATDRRPEAPPVEVEFSPSEKLDEALEKPKRGKALSAPEAPLRTVAHADAKPRKRAKSEKPKPPRRKKGE